jgi:hypothetical protein
VPRTLDIHQHQLLHVTLGESWRYRCPVWDVRPRTCPLVSIMVTRDFDVLLEERCAILSSYSRAVSIMLLRHHSLRRAIVCSYSNQQRAYRSGSAGRRGGSEPAQSQQQQQQRRRQQQQWGDESYSSYNSRQPRRRVEKAPRVQLRRPGQLHTYLVSCHPGLEQVSTAWRARLGFKSLQDAALCEITAHVEVDVRHDVLCTCG